METIPAVGEKHFLVAGEHWSVPGRRLSLHSTKEGAERRCAEIVNDLLSDTSPRIPGTATAANWATFLERVQDRHGAQYCYVEVTELPIEA